MLAAQIAAVVIFVVMFVLIIMDKIERHYVTLGCGAITLVLVFGFIMHDFGAIWHTLAFENEPSAPDSSSTRKQHAPNRG